MKCKFGKPLTEDEISMLIDGLADDTLVHHVESCPSCQQRVKEARQSEQALKAHLYRDDCPSPLELGDYNLGLISPDQFESITEHLTRCAACKEELRILRDFLDETEASQADPSIISFPTPEPENIVRPDETYFHTAQQIKMVAQQVRGSKKQQYRYVVDGIDLLFDVQESSKGVALEGLLLEPDDAPLADWVDSLVEVWTDGDLTTIGRIESDGSFRCDPVSPGTNEIRIIARTGKILVITDFEVKN